MKRILSAACVLALAATTFAQESEKTTVKTTETVVEGGADLISELWNFEDAVPLSAGRVDLRFTGRWITASFPANGGESSDDFIATPSIVWGAVENLELSLGLDAWVGEGGDVGPYKDGNYDSTVGMLWRIYQQGGECSAPGCISLPSVALSGSVRLPTGCSSSGVDGQLGLVLTNEYASGIRSHLNLFGKSVNGHNQPDARSFQWGTVIGLDGPLCNDGSVRWVADYMNRSSYRDGAGTINMLELGWEWNLAAMSNLGMSFQIGLDDNEDTPNFGAGFTYSMSLTQ